jgi:hypothetical protein
MPLGALKVEDQACFAIIQRSSVVHASEEPPRHPVGGKCFKLLFDPSWSRFGRTHIGIGELIRALYRPFHSSVVGFGNKGLREYDRKNTALPVAKWTGGSLPVGGYRG